MLYSTKQTECSPAETKYTTEQRLPGCISHTLFKLTDGILPFFAKCIFSKAILYEKWQIDHLHEGMGLFTS